MECHVLEIAGLESGSRLIMGDLLPGKSLREEGRSRIAVFRLGSEIAYSSSYVVGKLARKDVP